jgi:hypothetical protein
MSALTFAAYTSGLVDALNLGGVLSLNKLEVCFEVQTLKFGLVAKVMLNAA